jgi:hypothetical protein
MEKKDIKKIMIVFRDNDFVRVWDWIGKVTLMTLIEKNCCDEEMLGNTRDIESFVHSLLPAAIEFTQYRVYRNIDKDEVNRLVESFKDIEFRYNFDEETDADWECGGCELLIIDLEKGESFIR